MPDKLVDGTGRIVKAIRFQGRINRGNGLSAFGDNPAVQRVFDAVRCKPGRHHARVHFGKSRHIPEFGCEIAITFNPAGGKANIPAGSGHGAQGETQRIGTILINQIQRVDDIALGFRHLGAMLVTHQVISTSV